MTAHCNPIAILAFVAAWRAKYACPCPTAAICHDLAIAPTDLELQLARMQHLGQIRRRRAAISERDVELVV